MSQPYDPFSKLKAFIPRTLFKRALLIIIVPLILLQLISTYVFYVRHVETLTQKLAGHLITEIEYTISEFEKLPNPQSSKPLFDQIEKFFKIKVQYEKKLKLKNKIRTYPSLTTQILSNALESSLDANYAIDAKSKQDHMLISVQVKDGILIFDIHKRRLSTSTTYIFIVWMIGSSIILFTIAIIFLRNQIRPIIRLANAADNFGKGRDDKNFRPKGALEVRQAANAFIKMKQRITQQIQQRTEMLAGVSHDLRTPLTRMNLALEMIKSSQASKKNIDKYVSEIDHDIIDMEEMINAYLTFAKGEGTEENQSVKISNFLTDLTSQVKRQHRKFIFSSDESPDLDFKMPIKPNALKRALINLINNGFDYGDTVWLRTKKLTQFLIIYIDDNGPGIPKQDRESVFKPFVRLASTDSIKRNSNIGLGLPITRDIILSHGGDIKLSDSPKGGLRVKITLPL
ncbi:MAG: HAMP domain-containing protein [Alphaproteobacteria bacterium]|nr:HAMP domain-containing protein [Alphaproteobacteria bacterium]MBP9876707.1 HAMP domain-containing protein [Alphaproteobacteria bacterium]